MLLAALQQFKYQATNRLLLAASEEYGDSATTQKNYAKKTPVKMLPLYVYYKDFQFVNNYGKQIWKLKKKLNISGYSAN